MIRPLHDYLLVELDAVVEKKSLITIVGDVERVLTGVVKRCGPGRWIPGTSQRMPMETVEGDKVAFFKENFETLQGKEVSRIVSELSPGMVLVRERDLLYAWDPTEAKLYLTPEQLEKVPETLTLKDAGLNLTEDGGEFPHLHTNDFVKPRKTGPTCEADKVEEREVVLESDLVKELLG